MVDEQGWEEITGRLEELQQALQTAQAASAERLRAGGEGFRTSIIWATGCALEEQPIATMLVLPALRALAALTLRLILDRQPVTGEDLEEIGVVSVNGVAGDVHNRLVGLEERPVGELVTEPRSVADP